MHFHHRLAEKTLRKIGDLREDVVDQRLVLGKMLPAFLGDLVDLLAIFLGHRAGVAKVLEHRQRGIDRPGAR